MNYRIPPINGIGSTTPTRRDERVVSGDLEAFRLAVSAGVADDPFAGISI